MSTNKKDKLAAKKVRTPKFRVSFPVVWNPKAYEDGPEKYSITMLFDRKTDLKAMKKAAHAAAVEKWGSDRGKWPKRLKMPFRDGNEMSDTPGYENMIFVRATSKQRPGVIDQQRNRIAEEDDTFYAGCYAHATLIAFAYDTKGNRGVAFSLQNIQKLADGERFGGRRAAEDEFDEVEDTSDDESSYDDSDDDDDLDF